MAKPRRTTPSHERRSVGPVAFLGLGAMGAAMAANLVRKGFSVRVWNRTAGPGAALAALGATVELLPSSCARGAAFIVTMLRDAEALHAVLGGPNGVLEGLDGPGKRRGQSAPIVIDMSTVGRAAALDASRAVEARGGLFLDAPVSGSLGPAERGELVAMVGGKVKVLARAEPVLLGMCRKILHAGGVGQGQALKVVLNGVGAHHLVAFTSMLALGERTGLPREVLVDAFTTGAFASPSYVSKKAKVLARDYSPEFSLELTLKDCALAAELRKEVGLDLPVHAEIVRTVADAVKAGLGPEDLFALEKYFVAR